MHSMTAKEFQKRWNDCGKAPEKIQVKTSKRAVDLSIKTIIDRYLDIVEQGVESHDIDPELCKELCDKANAFKKVLAKVDERKIQHLKVRPVRRQS